MEPALRTVNALRDQFPDRQALFVVYENDSSDNTLPLLRRFYFHNGEKIVLTEKGVHGMYKRRTERIAHARNKVMETVRTVIGGGKYRYLVWIDLDDVNFEVNLRAFRKVIELMDRDHSVDVVTACQYKTMYDLWALRTKAFDRNVIPYNEANEWYHPFTLKRYFPKIYRWRKFYEGLQEVLSAFGGLGIYRTSILGDCRYDAEGGLECEHVAFNRCLRERQGVKIYVDPYLLNSGEMHGRTDVPFEENPDLY